MRQGFENSAQKLVGKMLRDRWRVDHLIDVGGIAAVYAATHRNGNRVAMKVMHALYAFEPTIKRRFLEEGYVANRVGHPDSVTVLDDGELDDGTPFLVMELLEGESLERLLKRRGTLDIAAVALVASRVLDVLASGHDQGIVHRDIKPANIFLTSDAGVKVLDYGLARVRERSFKGSVTKTGMVLGTASYMPPEQARGKRDMIDARTDVWAVGATMFTALSGQYVHLGDTTSERLILAASARARSVRAAAPDLAPEFSEVIDKALMFQRSERFSTARDMQAALADAYSKVLGRDLPGTERTPGGPWSSGAHTGPSDEPTDVDVPVSVLFDPDPTGQGLIVEFENDSGRSDRFALRRKQPSTPDDDELSDVSVIELED